MVAALIIIVLLLLVATAAVAAGLRRMVREEAEVEDRLRAPDTPTIAYAVPHGVDPADLRAAVARAGFTSIVQAVGTHLCLEVECAEGDRARLRHVIEEAHLSAHDGTQPGVQPVVFEDERTEPA